MEKEFATYEIALALKELGFDEPCFATIDQIDFIHIKGTKYPPRGSMMYDTIDCPTYSQAFRWFREKYKLKFYIREDIWNHWCSVAMILEDSEYTDIGEYETYREAELTCLAKLIEIAKVK